jgi:HK97 family phage prohead protease
MKGLTYKNISTEMIDFDASKRTVVAYVSKFGNIDLDRDVMMQGCYKKSIIERGSSGTNELFHLSNHRTQPEFVLSKPIFEEDNIGLKMTSVIRDSSHGNDILKGYQDGIWNQHSVMFSIPKGKSEIKTDSSGDTYQVIYEAKLYEGSTVLWGANPDTPTIEVKNVFKEVYDSDLSKVFAKLTTLTKAYRKGTFTDEFFPLLEIEIKMLEQIISENFEVKQSNDVAIAQNPQKDNQGIELIKWFIENK